MRVLIALVMIFSSAASYAQDDAAPAPTKDDSVSLAAPTATTSTKMELPPSRERNAIIFAGGIAGTALGYSVAQANGKDNVGREIMYTFLGSVTGFAIGSYMGLKFYPPVLAPTADGKGTSALLTVQF